jgi:hypothetical protein
MRAAVIGDSELRMEYAPHRAVHNDDPACEGIIKSLLTKLSIFHEL